MLTQRTLSGLLQPFRVSAVAEAVGVSRAAVNAWRAGTAVPDVLRLPKLAELLRIDLGELAQIVADDAARLERERSAA